MFGGPETGELCKEGIFEENIKEVGQGEERHPYQEKKAGSKAPRCTRENRNWTGVKGTGTESTRRSHEGLTLALNNVESISPFEPEL